ncbi:MAG: hypothetical protein DRP86_05295 [Candidatus Neomarinimicrobiota bacterium]|nr:MAG: hypothetical protein DRP86_05295 [Candidatus Neomarinimicrobiota bacterium]
MKKLHQFILLLFTATVLLAQNPAVVRSGDKYVFTWSEKAEVLDLPSQLTMNHLNGDVLIRGYHEESIRYIEKMLIDTDSRKDAEALWKEYHLKLEKDKNGYIVNKENKKKWSYGMRKIQVEYIVDVPTMTSIAVNTLGGDIYISDIQGAVELVSAGGDVRVENTRGRIFAKTYGGDTYVYELEGKIDIKSAGGDIEMRVLTGDISVETAGGDILMRDMNGNLDITTMGGDIELSGMTGLKTRLTTMGGDIEVEDCESEIYLETKGGEISLRDISGPSKGKTYGGNIEAKNLNGSTDLKTLGGDIDIFRVLGAVDAETDNGSIRIVKLYSSKFDDHHIYAISKNGSISLELPESADALFNLTTRGYDNKIKSEFELETTRSDRTRKTASGKSGKGTYPVEIFVENGSITINKLNQETR